MSQLPGIFMLAAWVLIGPINFHHETPTLIITALIVTATGVAVLVRGPSRQKSTALLGVLGLMFLGNLQLIAWWLHVRLIQGSLMGVGEAPHLMSAFSGMKVGLAIIGVAAACTVAGTLEVKNAHLPLAKSFPGLQFVAAPTEVADSVRRLSQVAAIASPRVSLIDSGNPAAFITQSKKEFTLAISVGLLESLTSEELEACIAHELSHVKNNDFVVRSFATWARVALFFHPLGHLIEPALYRAREFLADRTAVRLLGDRSALISALSKIRESQQYADGQSGTVMTACLFNPASTSWLTSLFDKYPTLESRIDALQQLNPFE